MNVSRLHPKRVVRGIWLRYRKRRSRSIPFEILAGSRLGVVAATQNRSGGHVENFLRSISRQTLPRSAYDVTLVDHGSEPHHLDDLEERCERYGVRLLSLGRRGRTFNKSLCLNAGVCSFEGPEFILSTDVDMIFAPNFLETVLRTSVAFRPAMVMCQLRRLPEDAVSDDMDVVKQFDSLLRLAEATTGTGPCMAAPREWWVRVRGYDERMPLYGEDTDLMVRAERDGLRAIWISDLTTFLHQWHEPYVDQIARRGPEALAEFERQRAANHRLIEEDSSVVRNPGGWGEALAEAVELASDVNASVTVGGAATGNAHA